MLLRLQLQPFSENVGYDELPRKVYDLLVLLHRNTLLGEGNSPFAWLFPCINSIISFS